MATKRTADLTDLSGSMKPTDFLLVSTPTLDRRLALSSLLASLGFAPYTVATLPSGVTDTFIYVTNGRKDGEGSGNGTGVVCSWNGSDWVTVDAGTAVAA